MYWQDILHSFSSTLVASVFAGIASLVAGLIATSLNNRIRRERAKANEDIDRIARTLHAGHDAEKEAAIEKVVEKISADTPRSEILQLVASLQALTKSQPEAAAVEGLISGYHEQALAQAQAQFWFSVAAATTGFAWILYAGTDIKPDNLLSVMKTFPGVVMDAVAFLFFKQASETRQRATDLYDRLRRDRQTANSVALVSSIEDFRVRSAVKAQMALHMAGLQPSPIDLSNFLSAPGQDQKIPHAKTDENRGQISPSSE